MAAIPVWKTAAVASSWAKCAKNGIPKMPSNTEVPSVRQRSISAAGSHRLRSVFIRIAERAECGASVRRASPVAVRRKRPSVSSATMPRVASGHPARLDSAAPRGGSKEQGDGARSAHSPAGPDFGAERPHREVPVGYRRW